MFKKVARKICIVMGVIMILSSVAYAYDYEYALVNPYGRAVVGFEDGNYTNFTQLTNPSATVGGETVYGYEIFTEKNGNKAVHFNNAAGNSELVYNVPTGNINGKLSFTIDINVKDANTSDSSTCGRIDFIQSSPWISATYFRIWKTDDNKVIFNLVDGGGLDGSGTTAWLGNAGYELNHWYKLVFNINIAKGTYQAWVIDKETGNRYGRIDERKLSSVTQINSIYIRAFNNKVADFMIDNFELKFDKVLPLTDPVITEENDNTISAAVTVKNDFSAEEECPTLILAVYNEKGELVEARIDNNDGNKIPGKTNVGLLCVGIAKPNGNYKAKAFLWDKSTLVPYTEVAKIPADAE